MLVAEKNEKRLRAAAKVELFLADTSDRIDGRGEDGRLTFTGRVSTGSGGGGGLVKVCSMTNHPTDSIPGRLFNCATTKFGQFDATGSVIPSLQKSINASSIFVSLTTEVFVFHCLGLRDITGVVGLGLSKDDRRPRWGDVRCLLLGLRDGGDVTSMSLSNRVEAKLEPRLLSPNPTAEKSDQSVGEMGDDADAVGDVGEVTPFPSADFPLGL